MGLSPTIDSQDITICEADGPINPPDILAEFRSAIGSVGYVETTDDLRDVLPWLDKVVISVDENLPGIFRMHDGAVSDDEDHITLNAPGYYAKRVYKPSKFRERANTRYYGADPDAPAETNRIAFQKAMASISLGGMIRVPAGDYTTDSTPLYMPSHYTALEGDGYASNFRTNNPTGDVLNVQGAFCVMDGIQFSSSVPRASGSYVNLLNGAHRFTLRNFLMYGAYRGVTVPPIIASVTLQSGYIFATVATTGRGVDIFGGFDVTIRDVCMDGDQTLQPQAGVWVKAVGDLTIEDCNIIGQGTDLVAAPCAGDTIASMFVVNTFLDTAKRGALLYPTGGGVIVRSGFNGVRASSHANQGVLALTSDGGIVDGFDLVDCQMFLNGMDGFRANDSGVKNIGVLGGQYAQNAGTALSFGPNVQRFKVKDATIGEADGLLGNGVGLAIDAGCDNFIVKDNIVLGNGVNATIVPTLGPTRIVKDNIGCF